MPIQRSLLGSVDHAPKTIQHKLARPQKNLLHIISAPRFKATKRFPAHSSLLVRLPNVFARLHQLHAKPHITVRDIPPCNRAMPAPRRAVQPAPHCVTCTLKPSPYHHRRHRHGIVPPPYHDSNDDDDDDSNNDDDDDSRQSVIDRQLAPARS